MTELDRALGDLHAIRQQVAHTTEFRGYGPATLAGTSLLAVAAATVQAVCLPHPAAHISAYLGLWSLTALLSVGLIAAEMYARTHRMHTGLADAMIRTAAEQFLPALAVGALLTVVLLRSVPGSSWMLPGLWQVVYAMGIFASCRFLPRAMLGAGAWFLLTGLAALSLADNRALSPSVMGIAYGVGQMLMAGILLPRRKENRRER